MSIYKHQQRDPWHLSLWLLGLLWRRPCSSHINFYKGGGTYRECELRSGHRGRHQAGGVSWGYGNNWLEYSPLCSCGCSRSRHENGKGKCLHTRCRRNGACPFFVGEHEFLDATTHAIWEGY